MSDVDGIKTPEKQAYFFHKRGGKVSNRKKFLSCHKDKELKFVIHKTEATKFDATFIIIIVHSW